MMRKRHSKVATRFVEWIQWILAMISVRVARSSHSGSHHSSYLRSPSQHSMLIRHPGAILNFVTFTLIISPYFLYSLPKYFQSASPLVVADSVQGLQLNSFVKHFEPLYYDRFELLHQYSRLKRSVVEKNRARDLKLNRTNTDGEPTTVASVHVISEGNTNRSNHEEFDHHHPSKGIAWTMKETDLSTNLTTTTTAFVRHNCPMPNLDPNSTDQSHIESIDDDDDADGHDSVDIVNHISIQFIAHNRHFKLRLKINSERVFASDVEFVSNIGSQLQYDTDNVLHGHLEDDEEALFEGIITKEGLLDGHLQTRNEEYYIEPASIYFDPAETRDFHSVIYATSGVNFPNATHGSLSSDFGSKYFPLLNPFHSGSLLDLDLLDSIEQVFRFNPQARVKRSTLMNTANDRYFKYEWSPFVVNGSKLHNYSAELDQLYSSMASTSKQSYPPSSSRMPSSPDHYRKSYTSFSVNSGGNRNPGAPGGGSGHDRGRYWRDMDSLHYTESEPYGIKAVHPRTHWIDDQRHHDRHVVVDPKKTTCMLYLQADHLFYEKMGSEEACIESMTRHVQKVNNIYKNTDFDQDGRPDNISFLIKRIKVHTLESLKDPEYRYPSSYGVEKFLELFSEEDYDAFCLAYMFTYRDFEGGTLGLAWTGDLKNAGGVCEKNGHYRGSLKSLNTGIVTLLNYGKHVPPIVSHVTLAHEIGHNFGSPHDPEDDHACTPGGENGNYIMFARATSGDKRNNNKFSPCSLRSINAVLNTKAKSLKGCFQEPQDAICGNEVVEEGEECDCGWEEDCKEPCCFPMRAVPPADEPPCRLRPNVICSPSQGPCCTQDCKLKVGNKCRDDNGCRTASYCNGQGPQCPPSTNKANKTICNEEYVCYMGECTGSICMAYGLESCQCKQGPNDPVSKLCELCCRMPSDDSTCKSSFEWNTTPYDVPDLYAKPGTPCDNYNGYCDVNQRCREVDPSSPLATLRRLLLSNESMASLKRWFNEQWFYVAVLVLITVLILLMAYKVFNSRRSMRLTKTDILEVALEAVAKHQQEQAQQQQQQQQNLPSDSNGDSGLSGKVASSTTASSTGTSVTNLPIGGSTPNPTTPSTASSTSLSSVSTKVTNSGVKNSTPTISTNSTVQPRNSVDSQASQEVNSASAAVTNSYQFNGDNPTGSGESKYPNGSMSGYHQTVPLAKQLSDGGSKQSSTYGQSSGIDSNSSSVYGTMKNPTHQSSQINSGGANQQYYGKHGQKDLPETMYNHPFSNNTALATTSTSIYGYTGSGPTRAVSQHSSGSIVNQHHHHSIPSLYQPSMIFQQPTLVQSQTQPYHSYYDTSAAALAIVGNQPSSQLQHYGATGAHHQSYQATEPAYGQYYYPSSTGTRHQPLNFHPTSNYYPSSSLYDYIPFPRPVNPNAANPKPPPLPSLASHPSHSLYQATTTTKARSTLPTTSDPVDTRRLYDSTYKDTSSGSFYDTGSAKSESKAANNGHYHHHHYYYHQLYGNGGGGGGKHYGTGHRSSASSASLHHHHPLQQPQSSQPSQSSQRHYQHYYSGHQPSQSSSHGSSSSARQHHSSHPQLLNTQTLATTRSFSTSSSSASNNYSTSYRRHQEIYEPLATLPLTSISHFGYLLDQNAEQDPIYYSTRSDVFANDNYGRLPAGSSTLSHSNSFNGHLDDFDLIGAGGGSGSGAGTSVADLDTQSESQLNKHSKSHGSSGWV